MAEQGQACLRLRSSDLLIPGSRQHRAWDSYLHPPAAWTHRKPSWFVMWHGPLHVDAYLQQLAARYDATVQQVAATWPTNTFARIEAGRSALTRDEKLPLPESAKALRAALLALLPRVTLPTLLIEVENWVQFRHHVTHPHAAVGRSWAVRAPALDVTLVAVVLAQGCHLPLSTMAKAASPPYHHLVHIADWYVREATIRQAIIALVGDHHNLPLTARFGAGTSAFRWRGPWSPSSRRDLPIGSCAAHPPPTPRMPNHSPAPPVLQGAGSPCTCRAARTRAVSICQAR